MRAAGKEWQTIQLVVCWQTDALKALQPPEPRQSHISSSFGCVARLPIEHVIRWIRGFDYTWTYSGRAFVPFPLQAGARKLPDF